MIAICARHRALVSGAAGAAGLALLLLLAAVVAPCAGQAAAPGAQSRQQQPLQAAADEPQATRISAPMVDVERGRNKSTVDVHVPLFFDMINQKDNEGGGSKLDLSVLQGLVTVNRDKARDRASAGPMKVTVFGIPVYTSKGYGQAPLEATQREVDANLAQVNSTLNRSADELAQVTRQTHLNTNKVLDSLSDIFERFSSVLRQTGRAAAGIPATGQQQQQQAPSPPPQQQLLQQQQ